MDFFQAAVLGVLQGITEWIPVSSKSQAMLSAVSLFGIPPAQALSYSLFLHIGTLFAALVFFKREIKLMLFEQKNKKTLWFLFYSTLASAVVGLPLFLFYRHSFAFASGELFTAAIGVGLVITGIILLSIYKKKGERIEAGVEKADAFISGFAQGFSVLPGISRSATSTAALLARGFTQESALRLSFLMSIPLVAAAEIAFTLLEGLPALDLADATTMLLFSFATGLIALKTFLEIARKVDFSVFCILLGAVAAIPLALSFL